MRKKGNFIYLKIIIITEKNLYHVHKAHTPSCVFCGVLGEGSEARNDLIKIRRIFELYFF